MLNYIDRRPPVNIFVLSLIIIIFVRLFSGILHHVK